MVVRGFLHSLRSVGMTRLFGIWRGVVGTAPYKHTTKTGISSLYIMQAEKVVDL